MSWLYYLLEANLYLILFYGFYRLSLHRETFYSLNRYYLIFSSILAFILPFFQLGFLKAPVIEQINIVSTETADPVQVTENLTIKPYQTGIFTFDNIIIAVYILVVTVFLIKLFFGLSKIIRMLKLPSLKLENGVKVIDLKDSKIAFSFFNLLFLDPLLPEKSTIIKHELVHIKQRHSLDVLLFEIIQIINWFNPVSYLVKKDIKLIHEYLADEETTKGQIEKYQYAMFLIQNSTGAQNLTLTNQIFSSSILKKRISMLNQKKSARWARLKLLSVLPITMGILCTSTLAFTKDYGFVELGTTLNKFPAKQDTVKKPFDTNDGIHVPNVKELYLALRRDPKTQKLTTYTKKLILLNGKEIKAGTSGGVKNIQHMITLTGSAAKAKYGERGANGAIEIISSNPEIVGLPPQTKPANPSQKTVILAPPPPVGRDTTKNKKSHKEPIKARKAAIANKMEQKYQTNASNKIPDIKLEDINTSKVEQKKVPQLVLEMHQDEIVKRKNDKLTINIPQGAIAELTVYNSTYDKAFYKSADYRNDWNAKELPDGNYPYNFVFRKDGKVVGGKSGFVQIH
ncbi:M56 family metallopeptidase [Pedobacter sp. UBA5917]|jgi:beta-lactamase regulating signal transducer with metallopeptidase domain|uniref:M56 family metallopeptidase n=1 Tax=Pedobacter sp. UBA5917 TaxID=1947061 RepID=UPI0025FB075C|nr:M56 family metallopeptidase [Pedobacter sp. UBA5917]